jgi:hypothetical protein
VPLITITRFFNGVGAILKIMYANRRIAGNPLINKEKNEANKWEEGNMGKKENIVFGTEQDGCRRPSLWCGS